MHDGAACESGKHNCLNLTANCSGAPAFRGFTSFNWQEWFELTDFTVSPVNQTDEEKPPHEQLNYRLHLRIRNKKLTNFTITFADVKKPGFEDILLTSMPENFREFFLVHRATFENFKQGEELDLEFDFAIVDPDPNLSVINKLIEIETENKKLVLPKVEIEGRYNIERSESSRIVFSFDLPVQRKTKSIQFANLP